MLLLLSLMIYLVRPLELGLWVIELKQFWLREVDGLIGWYGLKAYTTLLNSETTSEVTMTLEEAKAGLSKCVRVFFLSDNPEIGAGYEWVYDGSIIAHAFCDNELKNHYVVIETTEDYSSQPHFKNEEAAQLIKCYKETKVVVYE